MTLTIVPAPSLSRRSARAAAGSRPLAALPMPVPATPGTTRMQYGLAAVDLHGRVADRALYDALGWRPGQTLRLTVMDRSVVAAPDPGGAVRIGATGHLRLPADLLTAPRPRTPAPTFTEYVPRVRDAVGDGTRRVYGSYWNRAVDRWPDRRLDEITPTDIKQLVEHTKANVVARRNNRGGRSAAEHLVAALRCLYRHAEDDGLIDPADNPARKVTKPRRLPSTRRAVPDARLAEIHHAAASTGDDPALDTLLLRLHIETACRRGGALALRPRDLDPDQCLIFLREKAGTVRWQPVSPTLMTHLRHHTTERGSGPHDQLLRYASGRPITRRRYDHRRDIRPDGSCDVVALRIERIERIERRVDLLLWTGVGLGLLFTMVNVQRFAAADAAVYSPVWWAAWLLDPMVSLVLLAVVHAEQVTARARLGRSTWARITKWSAFAATYVMNTWEAWGLGDDSSPGEPGHGGGQQEDGQCVGPPTEEPPAGDHSRPARR